MKKITYLLGLALICLINYPANAALKQSTARNVMVFMASNVDHFTASTGLTLTTTLSKDGGAFASMGGTSTEVSSGWYKLALNTTDTATLGDLAIHVTATGADTVDFREQVMADLPGGAVSSVTGAVGSVTGNVGGNVTGSVGSVVGAVASVTAGVTVTTNNDKTGYALSSGGVQAIWDALTSALTTNNSIGKLLVTDVDTTISSRAASATALSTATWTSGRASNLDNLDAAVSTRLATSGYTAPSNASIAAIKAVTDLFLFDGSNYVKSNVQTNSDKTGYSLASASIPVKKNTALPNFPFPGIGNSTGTPTTGLTISCQRAIDGGSFASCTNSVAETASGYYKISFSAADLNGDVILVRFFGSGVKEKAITFITQ